MGRVEDTARRRMGEDASLVTVTVRLSGTCANGHPLSDSCAVTVRAGDSTSMSGTVQCACGSSGQVSGS